MCAASRWWDWHNGTVGDCTRGFHNPDRWAEFHTGADERTCTRNMGDCTPGSAEGLHPHTRDNTESHHLQAHAIIRSTSPQSLRKKRVIWRSGLV